MFHVGVEENVSVAVYDSMQPVTVKLYLQDYPFRRKTFSPNQVTLQPGKGKTKTLQTFFFFLSESLLGFESAIRISLQNLVRWKQRFRESLKRGTTFSRKMRFQVDFHLMDDRV